MGVGGFDAGVGQAVVEGVVDQREVPWIVPGSVDSGVGCLDSREVSGYGFYS